MVEIKEGVDSFINNLLEKQKKVGYGVKIYFSGTACSGPQFGMTFQEKAAEGDNVLQREGFAFFYDDETKDMLDPCEIEYINDPNFGEGLTIRDPNVKGCSSCGGGCQ
ncbi:MAG: iron-sulfur cluster biosynthesis family protein [Candidatus Methanomethylophilaceae archaeon]